MADRGAVLDAAGVPRPDGTPLGDAQHVLGVLAAEPDDRAIFVATRGVYDEDAVTGLSLGDLRELVRLAELCVRFQQIRDGV